MTLLTQEWAAHPQQGRINRTMWQMTQRTVLGCRFVFEQKGSSFVCMTLKAGVVEGGHDQFGRRCRAVRVVAIDTGGFTFEDRMPGLQVDRRLHGFVTVETGLCLGLAVAHRLEAGMQLVAASAADVFVRVDAAGPVSGGVCLVAVQADLCPFGSRTLPVWSETYLR